MTKKLGKIEGLEVKAFTNLYVRADGPLWVLDELKKRLTIKDKSVYFKMKRVEQSLTFTNISIKREFSPTKLAELNKKKADLVLELKELAESEYQIFWAETEDGKGLYIPRGFSYWGEGVDLSLNIPIKEAGLRDYQSEAIKHLLSKKLGTCVMATGLGKSRMIASVCMSFANIKKRTLVVVPSEYLVNQMAEDIGEFHKSVTKASSKQKPKLGADVLVATPITAKKYIDVYDTVVIDESHHLSARTWTETIMHADKADHIYNFTATPEREDGLERIIHAFAGPTEVNLSTKWGIENKWLRSFEYYPIITNSLEKNGRKITVSDKSSRATAYKKLVNNEAFLGEIVALLKNALDKDRKIIVLFRTLVAAKEFTKVCKNAGIKVNFASATFKKPLEDFAKGVSNVLVATDKLVAEGVNIPNADTLMNVLQNSSNITTAQSLGRILRLGEKKNPIVCDIVASGYKPFISSHEKRSKFYNSLAENGSKK